MSIYREEAIDTLTDMLQKKDFPNLQLMALDALSSLSGKSYTQAWLLNLAGFNKLYEAFKENENMIKRRIKLHILGNKRVASVLCNHEKDVIFEALEQCLKSKPIIIAKKCLVIATWLVYMHYNLPDTGVRDSARRSLLNEYIHILQSSKNLEDKILATVALRSFISDPEMWSASEGFESDSSLNGEVLSLIHVKRRVISSHSDGTIKENEMELQHGVHEPVGGVS
ncbi:hypothetical protein Hdeb2414_s0037g00733021 [Helianthus debilis subsp. tardiflorus]